MKALVFHGQGDVRVETVDDPVLQASTDVIVRMTRSAICGSDLHIYDGFLPQLHPMVLGHELVGVVEEVGLDVPSLRPGDRVVVPASVACGACFFCMRGLHEHCALTNPKHYGPEGAALVQKGGAILGFTDLFGGFEGTQAEYVRVPYAHVGPRLIPEELTDEQALFAGDILPTGWDAIARAQPQGGETVAVFGCGPVGLLAMKAAWVQGAARVIGVDREPYRLERAAAVTGAETLHADAADLIDVLRDGTDGRGADICVDAVGLEAHRTPLDKLANAVHMQSGSIAALRAAVRAVRRGGVVSVVGTYGLPYDNFPLGQIVDKGVTLACGQAPLHRSIDQMLALLSAGQIRADDIISHRLPLDEAPHGYRIFRGKEDHCVKVVLTP